jgi:DNA-binding IclR family transcriptional regulator
MSDKTSTQVKSLNKSIEIIEELERDQRMNLSEISKNLDIPNSTVHSHLSTLEANDLVVKEDNSYRLGSRFLELGGGFRTQNLLFRRGRSEVDQLARETGELANLMIEENGWGVHIYLSKGENAMTFDTHIGKRFPLHNNSLGKAILSEFSQKRVESIINKHGLEASTESTITDREKFIEELQEIQDRGYAIDDQERLDGLRCVGAPVVVEDRVLGSLSVSGPASRINGQLFETELPEILQQTSDIISINIKYEY